MLTVSLGACPNLRLFNVSPSVSFCWESARLLPGWFPSVAISLSLEELHEILQLTFGLRCEPFYSFRIYGQEIDRQRHLRARLLREFQLQRLEKFLYTYDFLDLWEWKIRVPDINRAVKTIGGRAAWPGVPQRHPRSVAALGGTCGSWIRTSTIRRLQSRD